MKTLAGNFFRSVQMRSFVVILSLIASAQLGFADEQSPDIFPDHCGLGQDGKTVTGGNFNEIKRDTSYRSAQLSAQQFETALETCKIDLVLNLRNVPGGDGDDAYRKESEISARLGAKLINIPMSATRKPSRETALNLIRSLRELEGHNVLIHCKAGADRTGLYVALYRWLILGESKARARKQALSTRYGHLPFGETQAMDRFYKSIQGTNLDEVEAWVENTYQP